MPVKNRSTFQEIKKLKTLKFKKIFIQNRGSQNEKFWKSFPYSSDCNSVLSVSDATITKLDDDYSLVRITGTVEYDEVTFESVRTEKIQTEGIERFIRKMLGMSLTKQKKYYSYWDFETKYNYIDCIFPEEVIFKIIPEDSENEKQ